jgi:hypothetical protein
MQCLKQGGLRSAFSFPAARQDDYDKPVGKMAHKQIVAQSDGTKIILRAAYSPSEFSVPPEELLRLARIPAGYGSEDVLDEYDGELSMYHRIRRFERDGKQWILLQNPEEFVIEVESTRGQMGEIRPLPPEDAWRLARELDRTEKRYPIVLEPGSALP